MGADVRRAVAGTGLCRGRDGAGCAGRHRAPAAGPLPRRHAAAERRGLGADQRAVRRLLAARAGVCGGRRGCAARAARGGGGPALPAVPVAGGRGRGEPRRAAHHVQRPGHHRGDMDAGCAGAGRVRHQSAVLGPGPAEAAHQRAADVHGGRSGCRRPAQRFPRPLQSQAGPGDGQPVAVPAVRSGAPAGYARMVPGGWRDRPDRIAGRRPCGLDHLRARAAGVRLAAAGSASAAGRVCGRRSGPGPAGRIVRAVPRPHRAHHPGPHRG